MAPSPSAWCIFYRKFPGFERDIHGVERAPYGDYLIEVLS
jgi:hypothetical protein